jgi:acyl-CoA thioesterase-1
LTQDPKGLEHTVPMSGRCGQASIAGREGPRAALVRRDLLTLLAGAALMPACGGGDIKVTEGRGAAPAWVVLGSSTAAGVGASPGRSWAAQLEARLTPRGLQLDNRARGGATTYQALPAAAERPAGRPPTDPAQDVDRALESRPRALILAFPSNDAVLGYSALESAANLLTMRERAGTRGVPVLILSSQPRNDAGPAARTAMREMDAALAAALGPCFVDVRDALADADGRIAPAYAAGDGVHLNDRGHELVFDRLWAAISGGGCVTPP